MNIKSDELDRIFLWLLLIGGLISLLIYGLASFVAQPATETITIHAPALNSNNSTPDVRFHSRQSK